MKHPLIVGMIIPFIVTVLVLVLEIFFIEKFSIASLLTFFFVLTIFFLFNIVILIVYERKAFLGNTLFLILIIVEIIFGILMYKTFISLI